MSKIGALAAASVAILVHAGVAHATMPYPAPRPAVAGAGAVVGGGNATARGGGARVGSVTAQAGSGGSASTGGDDVKALGLAYTDNAPTVPGAVVSDGVVVTSQNIKVLGPLFGYAWQDVESTPSGIHELAALGYMATTNDGTYDGQRSQFAYIAALCATKKELAYELGFGCRDD